MQRIVPLFLLLTILSFSLCDYTEKNLFQIPISSQSTGQNTPYDVVSDSQNRIYVVGEFSDNNLFGWGDQYNVTASASTNGYIVAYNSDSSIYWLNTIIGSYSTIRSISIDPTESYLYVVGSFSETIYVGTISLTAVSSEDIFVAKLHTFGNVMWARNYGTTGSHLASKITSTTSAVLLCVEGAGSIAGVNTSSGYTDVAFLYLDAMSGDLAWAKSYGGNDGEDCGGVGIESTGHAVLVFSYRSTDLTVDGVTMPAPGDWNIYKARLTPDGASGGWDSYWATAYLEYVTDVVLDSNTNELYMVGFYGATIDWGNGVVLMTGAHIPYDGFIVKMQSGNTTSAVWTTTIGGDENDDTRSVCLANNAVYVSGHFAGTVSDFGFPYYTYGVYVAKYSGFGQLMWAHAFNTTDSGYLDAFVAVGSTQVAVVASFPNQFAGLSVWTAGVPNAAIAIGTDVPGSCVPCQNDGDCSGGRGVCVPSSIGSYCSCLSGFGGCDCSGDASATCSDSFSQVDALSGNFQANATVDFNYPMLFVTVDANLEDSVYGNASLIPTNTPPYSTETIIFFGLSGQYPSCSYPNGGYTWIDYAAQPGQCIDKYVANMTWAFAKDSCGFVAANGTRNYTQTVTIQRKYNLNGILQRTEQTTRSLYVIFPSEISVTTSAVTVSFPAADAFAAITFIDYNPDTQLWTVEVQTSIQSPYSLNNPTLNFLTGNLVSRIPFVSMSACSTVGTYCVQTITYLFDHGSLSDSCIGLSGLDSHSFQINCSTPSCPATPPLNISLSLNTGNACPATDFIQFSETSLTSFSDAGLTVQSDSFTINDQVYFGASVQTSEALISSRTIKPNSICFLPPSGSCFYANYTVLSPTNGKDPVFVVDLNGPGNADYFDSVTDPTQYSVTAVVQVSFVGAKGLLKNVPQTQTVQTISHATIGPAGEQTVSGASVVAPWMSLLLLLIATVL